MSVNVSSRRFSAVDFSEIESCRPDRFGADQPKLGSESAFLDDLMPRAKMVEKLRIMGVGCSLDDFGTGYSSLSYCIS